MLGNLDQLSRCADQEMTQCQRYHFVRGSAQRRERTRIEVGLLVGKPWVDDGPLPLSFGMHIRINGWSLLVPGRPTFRGDKSNYFQHCSSICSIDLQYFPERVASDKLGRRPSM